MPITIPTAAKKGKVTPASTAWPGVKIPVPMPMMSRPWSGL